MLSELIGQQRRQRDRRDRGSAQLSVSQDPHPAVLIEDAANEFVGKVPAVGQAAAGQRVVPAKLLLLELAQRLGMIRARLDEIEITLEQVVGQDGEQKVLQQAAGE